jgi:D-alanyl-D-alanine carboxypeptidase
MFFRRSAPTRTLLVALAACAAMALGRSPAAAEATILVDVESGKVLQAENATQPWYPASITKIMTAYSTLRAIKEGRITLETPITVSHNAAAQAPVKMGFAPGTTVTVDNALKMMMVKSANDIAVVLAEGVGGSIEGFADIMNKNAQRLGMTQSHFVNPNGLPADEQIISARDMAILARAAIKEFPEYDYLWHLPGIRMGRMVQRNYNTLIGRYPGADGMKTGFICASGFNLVATASRDGKRMIAVVLGASSSSARAIKAAQLLERGFTANPLSWLTPTLGTVDSLQPINAEPVNLREEMCGKHRKRQASEDEDDSAAIAKISTDSPYAVFLSSLRSPNSKQQLLQDGQLGEPVTVFTGTKAKPDAAPKLLTDQQKAKAKPKQTKSATANTNTNTNSKPSAAWSNLSPSSVANHAPADLKSTDGDKPATQVKPKAATPKEPAKKAATQDATKKTATTDAGKKSNDKSSDKAKQTKSAQTKSSQTKSSPTSDQSEKK